MKKEEANRFVAIIIIVVGILFLLKDYNVPLNWFKLNWWTAGFLIIGIKYCAEKFL